MNQPSTDTNEKAAPMLHESEGLHFHLAEHKDPTRSPFAFLATHGIRMPEKARLQHTTLAQLLQKALEERHPEHIRLLATLEQACEHAPFLEALYVSKRVFRPVLLSASEAYRMLQEIPAYERAGITVHVPQSWCKKRAPSRVQVTLTLEDAPSWVGLHSMFSFSPQLTLEGVALTPEEVAALLAHTEPLIQLRGQWVEVHSQHLSALLTRWEKAAQLHGQGLRFADAMRMLARTPISRKADESEAVEEESRWITWAPGQQLAQNIRYLLDPVRIPDPPNLPLLQTHLHATLRPYQLVGVKWLYTLHQLQVGGCLADDMGLGKTLQILALLLLCRQESMPSLIIVPASLLPNWQAELKKFAPSLRFYLLHPYENDKAFYATRPPAGWPHIDVLLTTYTMAMRLPWLSQIPWNFMILDEAQAIKNPSAKQTEFVKQLRANTRIALTGTPLENSLLDLWSILDFACPSLLATVNEFQIYVKNITEAGSYDPLRALIAPYLLRRKKTDPAIVLDLPSKTELKTYCSLSAEQVSLYKETLQTLATELKEKEMPIRLGQPGHDGNRKGLILKYLLYFKQICNHPDQRRGDTAFASHHSGKFLRLQELATQIAEQNESLLVFTQFRSLTEVLRSLLAPIFSHPGFLLHGGTSLDARRAQVEAFQAQGGFFILSLKAGGTGLTLTRANHVIHFDRWWNPAVEAQATDRAFRIGQQNPVMVHAFICQGTLESRIDAMMESKKTLSNEVLSVPVEEVALTELSDTELLRWIQLDACATGECS